MHEMSIAQSLVDILREEMVKNNARALKSVRLHVGQMSAVVPDSLSFCFNVITKETELEGAELVMEVIPIEGLCRECKETFLIEDYAFECPHCGSKEIKTISGQDLSIVEIEVN
jgi:hydrogenase nickel incorporation protein HypA/HybF